MPIVSSIDSLNVEEDLFKAIAYRVTGHAINIHNEFGRLYNENIYKQELLYRLKYEYEKVAVEVPQVVTFKDFRKVYYVDLVVNGNVPFELKAVDAISDINKAQILNYLYLTGLQRGKILNFRTDRVKGEFASTTLTHEARHKFTFDADRVSSPDADKMTNLLYELCCDWGVFLKTSLYSEALTYLLGGEDRVIQKVPVSFQGRKLGYQKMHLLNHSEAFKVTSFKDGLGCYESHLDKLLSKTPLEAVYWYNFNNHDVELKVVKK